MKAALNGVPSLSVLDGWWIEGHVEGVTGWAIGADGLGSASADGRDHADALYDTLERTVVPLYYAARERFIGVMRNAIALNGSFFNAQRMVNEYVVKAYGAEAVRDAPRALVQASDPAALPSAR
jgi:starch phosphorylase